MDFDDNSDEEDIDIDEEEEEEEGEENAQEDYHLDDLLDQDLNWELEVARRKKRWKLKEEELRNRDGNENLFDEEVIDLRAILFRNMGKEEWEAEYSETFVVKY